MGEQLAERHKSVLSQMSQLHAVGFLDRIIEARQEFEAVRAYLYHYQSAVSCFPAA